MEEGRCPLYMVSRRFPSETEGEGGVLFAFYDMFFPLYNQTALIFCVLPPSGRLRVRLMGGYLFKLREVSRLPS